MLRRSSNVTLWYSPYLTSTYELLGRRSVARVPNPGNLAAFFFVFCSANDLLTPAREDSITVRFVSHTSFPNKENIFFASIQENYNEPVIE